MWNNNPWRAWNGSIQHLVPCGQQSLNKKRKPVKVVKLDSMYHDPCITKTWKYYSVKICRCHFPTIKLSILGIFRFWHFQILHFPIQTLSDTDTFWFCHLLILTISDFGTFQFWHFPIPAPSDSVTFRFCHFPILTLSNFDTFQIQHFLILAFWTAPWPLLNQQVLPTCTPFPIQTDCRQTSCPQICTNLYTKSSTLMKQLCGGNNKLSGQNQVKSKQLLIVIWLNQDKPYDTLLGYLCLFLNEKVSWKPLR